MVRALRRKGYEVVAVDNGDDAHRFIWESPPDLVLLDIMMPGRNGLDICSQMKADSVLRNIPVIILTCLTSDSTEDDAYWKEKTAADDFLSKPCALDLLIQRVERLLQRKS